jgi:hypothetical protein
VLHLDEVTNLPESEIQNPERAISDVELDGDPDEAVPLDDNALPKIGTGDENGDREQLFDSAGLDLSVNGEDEEN